MSVDPANAAVYDSGMKRIAVIALLCVSTVAFSENQWDFSFAPRFYGLTAGARYALSEPLQNEVETSVVGAVSAAYESSSYYRLADGSLFDVPEDAATSDAASYNRFNGVWQFGIQQGLFPRQDSTDDLAVGFLLYRGQYDIPFGDGSDLFAQSGLAEADSGLLGSIIGGVAYSRVLLDNITRVRSGIEGELAFEWGPSFLHNQLIGAADFTRTTLWAKGFLPLFAAEPSDGRNSFSLYLAGAGYVDWARGPEIPFAVLSTTGGRGYRSATGGSARGFESRRFDATFKAIGNVELRASLPAIVLPTIVPGILLYTDVGYYADALERSPVDGENNGALVSSGAGIYFDLLNTAELVLYTNALWTGGDVEAETWAPFSVGFGFHL